MSQEEVRRRPVLDSEALTAAPLGFLCAIVTSHCTGRHLRRKLRSAKEKLGFNETSKTELKETDKKGSIDEKGEEENANPKETGATTRVTRSRAKNNEGSAKEKVEEVKKRDVSTRGRKGKKKVETHNAFFENYQLEN